MDNTHVKVAVASETSLAQDVRALLAHWFGGRRGLLLAGVLAATGGLWLGWSSLVAAGLAPLLLSVLPCVVMCALGLCMKGHSKSHDSNSANTPDEEGNKTQRLHVDKSRQAEQKNKTANDEAQR
jgi:hypothetical protein